MAPRRQAPPPTVVLLVRHGKTATTGLEMPAPGSGPGLSDEGTAQVEVTAERIASWRPSLPELSSVYTSLFLADKADGGDHCQSCRAAGAGRAPPR